MKDKENENQKSEEPKNKRGLEPGGPRGFSNFNHIYPPFLAYDLTPNLPEESLAEEKEKPASYRDDPEALKAIEQFEAYSSKIRPPIE